jgi:hypothetical protein
MTDNPTRQVVRTAPPTLIQQAQLLQIANRQRLLLREQEARQIAKTLQQSA